MDMKIILMDEKLPFDHFVNFNPQNEKIPDVLLDVEIDTGEVSIGVESPDGSTPYSEWCGMTRRFPLHVIPTPEGANHILKDDGVLNAVQDLLNNSKIIQDGSGNCRGTIEDADECAVQKALEDADQKWENVVMWDAKIWFLHDPEEIYDDYCFESNDDESIVKELKEAYHGDGIHPERNYLHDVEGYVAHVREVVKEIRYPFRGVSIDVTIARGNLHLGQWEHENGENMSDEEVNIAIDTYLESVEKRIIESFPSAEVSFSQQPYEGADKILVDLGDEYWVGGMSDNDIKVFIESIMRDIDL